MVVGPVRFLQEIMAVLSANNTAAVNNSDTCLVGCFLIGIPGLEHLHIWLSILFCTMYVDAVAGNGILICVILTQPSLQEPMYIFLSMLMFFTYFLFVADSAVLLAMAFDRYMAISSPLRYATIFTGTVTGKIVAATLAHSFIIMFPPIFLLKRLHYCRINTITHTFCEHVGIARMSYSEISINVWFGLAAALLSTDLDVILITVSCIYILRAVFHLLS
ncbi:Olfactory receptor 52B6, partial [Eschrichtius robustus]|nr:Olfactory receptor 52B6 [Eschrichtius robustus]